MTAPERFSIFVEVTFFVCLIYTVLMFAVVLVMLILSTIESRHRARQQEVEDFNVLVKSRYMVPVSIIATAYNEEVMVLASVQSLLRQNYPEFEVIVVDDGSTDGTLSILQREFELELGSLAFQEIIPSKPVESVFYKSRKDPRLHVVHKVNGGNKADGMNCGINFARYPYLCSVDGDTIYIPDALLKGMSLVAKDPALVVGVTSLFGISRSPEKEDFTAGGSQTVDRHLLSNFQHLDLMRSFVVYRLAWSRLGCMLCNPGAFAIWRRDVIVEVGGFSNCFSCEDIEMTFRIHEKFRREKRPYRIFALPDMVAWTEGPDKASGLVRQRARWQKVILETVWHYRHMFLRPGYGSVGMIGLPYYVFFEAFAPLMQALSLFSLALAIWLRLLDWPAYFAMVGIVVFASAIPTTLAIALHDSAYRNYGLRDMIRLLLIGPLDLFLYRPIIVYAGLRGSWQFLRGDRGWDKFERNVR